MKLSKWAKKQGVHYSTLSLIVITKYILVLEPFFQNKYKFIYITLNIKGNVFTHIIVEHKDRLTRFGFNYFEILLPKLNCELIVINRDYEEENDLIKDLISIITSYCCRLYGIRKGQSKSQKIKEVLQ